jgi:hypothetical protein
LECGLDLLWVISFDVMVFSNENSAGIRCHRAFVRLGLVWVGGLKLLGVWSQVVECLE